MIPSIRFADSRQLTPSTYSRLQKQRPKATPTPQHDASKTPCFPRLQPLHPCTNARSPHRRQTNIPRSPNSASAGKAAKRGKNEAKLQSNEQKQLHGRAKGDPCQNECCLCFQDLDARYQCRDCRESIIVVCSRCLRKNASVLHPGHVFELQSNETSLDPGYMPSVTPKVTHSVSPSHCSWCRQEISSIRYECQDCATPIVLCAKCRILHPSQHTLKSVACFSMSITPSSRKDSNRGSDRGSTGVWDGTSQVDEYAYTDNSVTSIESQRADNPTDISSIHIECTGGVSDEIGSETPESCLTSRDSSVTQELPVGQLNTIYSPEEIKKFIEMNQYFVGLADQLGCKAKEIHRFSKMSVYLARLAEKGLDAQDQGPRSLRRSARTLRTRELHNPRQKSGASATINPLSGSSPIYNATKKRSRLKPNRIWFLEEKRRLRQLKRKGWSNKKIGALLNRTTGAISQQWRKQQLEESN